MFKPLSYFVRYTVTDSDHSADTDHKPSKGMNVKRAIDNSTNSTTLEDYKYVVVVGSALVLSVQMVMRTPFCMVISSS